MEDRHHPRGYRELRSPGELRKLLNRRVGRRPLLLIGTAGMIITLGILGWSFGNPRGAGDFAHVAMIDLMIYVASFAISVGPVSWLLIAEIYPLQVRGLAEGTAATVNWLSNLLVSMTFLSLVQALGARWTFWMYALLALTAWIFAYYLVPETKGRTLEEIEHSWAGLAGTTYGVQDQRKKN